MFKNQIPLVRLMGIVFLAAALIVGTVGYDVSGSLDHDPGIWVVVVALAVIFILLVVSGFGLMLKTKWSRGVALSLLYLAMVGWTVLAYAWFTNTSYRPIHYRLQPFAFSIFFYAFFISGILLLNHPVIKNELGKEEEF